jgi:hypothetical protein
VVAPAVDPEVGTGVVLGAGVAAVGDGVAVFSALGPAVGSVVLGSGAGVADRSG